MARSIRRSSAQLAKGITVEGVRYGAIEATFDRKQGDNVWLTMALTEGKNREIRKICGHFGWPVSRLIRVAYGPFQLGSHLNPGDIEEVPAKVLREQLGGKQAGAQGRAAQLEAEADSCADARCGHATKAERQAASEPHADKPQASAAHKARPKPGAMRIEAGAHKGTKLIVPEGDDVRPTSDRARQAIFNMLIHRFDAVEGAACSTPSPAPARSASKPCRAARKAWSRWNWRRPALDALKRNITACHENARTLVFACDALNPPPAASRAMPPARWCSSIRLMAKA